MAAGAPAAHGGSHRELRPNASLGIYPRLTQSCINARKPDTGR
jgi:hypothetical protein